MIALASPGTMFAAVQVGVFPQNFNLVFLITVYAAVILGGIKRIGAVTSRLVPYMAVIYVTGGLIVVLLAMLANIFLAMPALSLAVSAMFVLLMSGLILFETQQIVRGGETNYIMATVTLFVSILNLFTSLLHLFGFASQE